MTTLLLTTAKQMDSWKNFHRRLKSALKCYLTNQWVDALPTIILGLCSIYKEELQTTVAELVYGKKLRPPGECFVPKKTQIYLPDYINSLRSHMQQLTPTPTSSHSKMKYFVPLDLDTCKRVFMQTDAVKPSLKTPYDGPYLVLSRTEKFFKILIKDKETVVSIDRLKPAYILVDNLQPDGDVVPARGITTWSGRQSEPPVRFQILQH